MDYKVVAKRRSTCPSKANKDVTPAKVRKPEVTLEQLTKQKVIEKYKKLQEDHSNLVAENEENKKKIDTLKGKVNELVTKVNHEAESRTVEVQTLGNTDDLTFNCTECIHTANCEKALKWHLFHDHNKGNPEILMNYSCNNCHQKFYQQADLMFHIKREHTVNVPTCKFFKDGKCHYSAEKCWFLHPEDKNPSTLRKSYTCNFCENRFDSKRII